MTTALLHASPSPGGTGQDLVRIVRINEELKRVVGVSIKINVMALNAIFLAKRAGPAALGFGVLSNEMRVFSQDLRTNMQALTGLIHRCVHEVSRALRHMRTTTLLLRTSELAPHGSGLAAILERRHREDELHAENLNRLRRQLGHALDNACQLVELGSVLAKSAKIEAAYGQAYAVPLSQVSSEFDGTVEEIRCSMEALRHSNFFYRR